MKHSLTLVIVLLGFVVGTPDAKGVVVITATETAGDVVFTGSGTVDLSALTIYLSNAIAVPALQADPPVVVVGPASTFNVDLFEGISLEGPDNFGSLNMPVSPDSGLGFQFGANFRTTTADPLIQVPAGYSSGSNLAGSMTFSGQTFSTLGITPGNYMWTWGSGLNADSLTLKIVPEPASFALLVVGAGVVFVGWGRRKQTFPRLT